ncbi:hypothetical protein PseudUWO311_08960 [Pseudanabaena sp. UWO311]|uniref:hypothetical protein n=1 Tax=Pseudanabaena sp. UWO311 TaxID=2487337 RepID=UPI00115A350C|nr:hypothetical protein [Pseudanabaena sp. UWO311]TYQ27441.1 hypothetical protein PseudUWO311_08960 [Pseudanabaena sp. UWO311]
MLIHEDLTLVEIAAIVSDALTTAGITAVLSGGGVVTIYSENEYQSDDLDFISPADSKSLTEIMVKLGFSKQGRHFEHPNTYYLVEFPPSPLMIGEQYVDYRECTVQKVGELELHILTPTLCVMDRLAGFYHWRDSQNLDQAVMVAKRHLIDLDKVKAWSKKEGKIDRYQEFIDSLKSSS